MIEKTTEKGFERSKIWYKKGMNYSFWEYTDRYRTLFGLSFDLHAWYWNFLGTRKNHHLSLADYITWENIQILVSFWLYLCFFFVSLLVFRKVYSLCVNTLAAYMLHCLRSYIIIHFFLENWGIENWKI